MNPPPPDAPRAAYLLTAALAGNTEQVGAIVSGDDMGAEWAGYIEMDSGAASRVECSAALVATRELVKPRPGSWTSPECAHCGEIIAKAMCSPQIQAHFRLGFTPAMIAAMCRQSADMAETSPRH